MNDGFISILGQENKDISSNRFLGTMKQIRNVETENIMRDVKLYSQNFKVKRDVCKVNIDKLFKCKNDWNPFPNMNDESKKLMKSSIEKYGIIYPLLVIKKDEDYYEVIDGFQRVMIQRCMFYETGDKRYENIDCVVFEDDEIDDLIVRDLIIDTNFSRKCNKAIFTKIIIMKIGIELAQKERKNEINICRKVATDIGVSESTIYSYLTLAKCDLSVLYLLEIGQITLSSARKMSKYESTVQTALLKEIGLDEIRSELIDNLPKKIDRDNVSKIVSQTKLLKHPLNAGITLDGNYDEIMNLGEKIQNIILEDNLDIKFKFRNESFKFYTGHKSLGTWKENIPKYFLEKTIPKEIPKELTKEISQSNTDTEIKGEELVSQEHIIKILRDKQKQKSENQKSKKGKKKAKKQNNNQQIIKNKNYLLERRMTAEERKNTRASDLPLYEFIQLIKDEFGEDIFKNLKK